MKFFNNFKKWDNKSTGGIVKYKFLFAFHSFIIYNLKMVGMYNLCELFSCKVVNMR